MRAQNPPPGSPPLEPDRPVTEEDVFLQTHLVDSTTNITSDHLSIANIDELQSSEPTPLLQLSTHEQNHHQHVSEEVDEAEVSDEEESIDYDTADVEEGGAPLYDIDMEETHDQPPMSALQDTPPVFDVASSAINNLTLQVLAPSAADPATSPVIVSSPQPVLEQDIEDQDAFGIGVDEFEPHPLFSPNGNPGILMPDNYNCFDFLQLWRNCKQHNQLKDIKGIPRNEISITEVKQSRIIRKDLKGDEYDLQGINWQHLGVTRSSARKCRAKTFRNYTNKPNSDAWNPSTPDKLLTRHENYFRFRSMDLRTDVHLLHFQLRNIMGCPSRTEVYYPCTAGTVRRLDPTTGNVKTAMSFQNHDDAQVSTLAAEGGMLVTGSFYGTYRYRPLATEDESLCYDGRLTDYASGITNHVQINSSRYSSTPVAAFASNDYGFRMVDLARNEIILDKIYDHALNCTALSMDKRLRVMVGDLQEVLITNAETGEVLKKLPGHRDYGFACDWAPDGWTVATSNQDKSIRIWDARNWSNSVSVIRTEMAGVRSLRFSPLGSGKRLLLAAEEADVINIIDAQTFNSKQTIDVFGELAGVSFTSAGQEIVALSSDPVRGGVLSLERCDYGAEDTFWYTKNEGYDWLPTPQQVVSHPTSQVTLKWKQRRAAMNEDCFF